MATIGMWGSLIGAGTQAYGAYAGSKATKAAIAFQASVYENNKQMAILAAFDAYHRGTFRRNLTTRRTNLAVGATVARAAGSGLVSANQQASQRDVELLGAMDEITTMENAKSEALNAWQTGVNAGANGQQLMARARSENSALAAGTSLLGNVGTVAERWYKYKDATNEPASSDISPLLQNATITSPY